MAEELGTACLFCRIVAGEISASIVHRDEQIVAFLDVNPVNPGHLLVIPAVHHAGIVDLPDPVGVLMWSLAHHAARILRETFDGVEGVNLLMSDGTAAAQSVFHSHLHVIPRRAGDGMVLTSPPRAVDRPALDAAAGRLSAALLVPEVAGQ